MAYTTYTTDAIVCGTYDRNTADRSYRLFTRELGMLYADARSVRLEKSKQRMALADFTLVRVSLVRGKAGWKVGSVVAGRNFYHEAVDQAARGSVRDLVRLVRRFVQGEEPQAQLFDFVIEALDALVGEVQEDDRVWLDLCVAVRVLALLGYVGEGKVPQAVRVGRPAMLAALRAPTLATTLQNLYDTGTAASHL